MVGERALLGPGPQKDCNCGEEDKHSDMDDEDDHHDEGEEDGEKGLLDVGPQGGSHSPSLEQVVSLHDGDHAEGKGCQ